MASLLIKISVALTPPECLAFPLGTAGVDDHIEYNALDISSNGLIVVGGYCKDKGLCGNTAPNPIIELLS